MGIDIFSNDMDRRLRKQKIYAELNASLVRNNDAIEAGDKATVEYESSYREKLQKELYYIGEEEELEEEINKASRNLYLASKNGDKDLVEKEKCNKRLLEERLYKIRELLNSNQEDDFSEIPFEDEEIIEELEENQKRKNIFKKFETKKITDFINNKIDGIRDFISENFMEEEIADFEVLDYQIEERKEPDMSQIEGFGNEELEKIKELILKQREDIDASLNSKSKKRKIEFKKIKKEKVKDYFKERFQDVKASIFDKKEDNSNDLGGTIVEITDLLTKENENIEYTKKMNRRA